MNGLDSAFRELVREVVREELRAQRSSEPHTPARETSATDAAYISTRKAAELADVHPATIREWVRRGFLREHRAGRELRVRSDELRAFLDRVKNTPTEVVDLDARADAILTRGRRRSG